MARGPVVASTKGAVMADEFDGVTPDMIRAAGKRAAAIAADRGTPPVVEDDAPPEVEPVTKARKQTTRGN